eukprot:5027191-Pyramimonas_sp.AAC.2
MDTGRHRQSSGTNADASQAREAREVRRTCQLRQMRHIVEYADPARLSENVRALWALRASKITLLTHLDNQS